MALRRSKQPLAFTGFGYRHEDGHTTLDDGSVQIVSGATIYLIKDGLTTTTANPLKVAGTHDYDPTDPPPLPANAKIEFAPHFAPLAARAHPQFAALIQGRKPREKSLWMTVRTLRCLKSSSKRRRATLTITRKPETRGRTSRRSAAGAR
ncbi:hypothetical protein GCM10025880_57060 [Methylorubrum aminovorans]|nr:hypothetical protein GCM10025880_57060 [Methylorubrum aminovorans]